MAAHPRVSSYVMPVLNSNGAGRVRGCFAHGMNVVTREGRLVYLGGYDKPLSCVGMQVPRAELRCALEVVAPNDEVRLGPHGISFLRDGWPLASISLEGAECVSLSFGSALSSEAAGRVARVLVQVDVAGGIGLARDEDLRRATGGLLGCLGTAVSDRVRLRAAVRWLLGRGLGLTPSGDDILCGFGAGCLALGRRDAHQRLCEVIASVRTTRSTTYVSEAYLDAMHDGCVNEGILALAQAAEKGRDLGAPLAQAMDYGHTSGCDMLLGFGLALA